MDWRYSWGTLANYKRGSVEEHFDLLPQIHEVFEILSKCVGRIGYWSCGNRIPIPLFGRMPSRNALCERVLFCITLPHLIFDRCSRMLGLIASSKFIGFMFTKE